MDVLKPAWIEPRTAYIHIPFCAHRCGYCDFAIIAQHNHLIDQYLDALTIELGLIDAPKPVESLYIGGGTPTQLSPDQLARLFKTLHEKLPFSTKCYEFTVECNPDDLTDEVIEVLADHGVNRLSLGIQSFQPRFLQALERQHRVEHIPQAIQTARRRIDNLSFDLIFAIPNQELSDWTADLLQAIHYEPNHISIYNLTYEKGTRLWKALKRRELQVVSENQEYEMYHCAMQILARHGYEHYEISNFARPGWRSTHNQRYWSNAAYWGFGVGAASYVCGERRVNIRDTRLYIQKLLQGKSVIQTRETLPPKDRAYETMALQLRRSDGIQRGSFYQQTGYRLDDLVEPRLHSFVRQGLLSDDGQSVSLTHDGKCVADAIITTLMFP